PAALVLATLRSSDEDPAPHLATLAEMGELERMPLGPLAAPEARALAGRLLDDTDDARAAAIAEEAHGHPLFIDALARHAAVHGGAAAPTLDEALLARVEALEPPARALLDLVALAGWPLPERNAQRALGLELAALGRAASALRLAHLVRMTR